MAHQGLREYSGEESGNVAIGQLGVKALTTGTLASGDGNFVAFKVAGDVATANVDISVVSHVGDSFDLNAVVTGEMVWGPFKSITISSLSVSTMHVLCYYGK